MAQFKINFEREKIYVAGRYCKFSRSLPQSPWTVDYDQPAIEGNSVSEKISNVMKTFCKAAETRFMSSGREDIDVRMLGNGRPFAVQIINAQITECFSRDRLEATLNYFKEEINKDVDIYVDHLALVTAKQAEKLNVGEEEKRKHYSALCYSRIPLTDEMLKKLEGCTPLTLKQNTVVRVLKRRALHERPRTIYNMRVCKLNDYRFMLK
jgi:tRNA pseudouridine synthase 10